MARAFENDLRRKLLEAYAGGDGTMVELARRFRVSYGWVRKIVRSQRQTGSTDRVPQRRRGSVKGLDDERLRAMVARRPDAVLRELQAELAGEGVAISIGQLWLRLKQAGLRLKKSRSMPRSATSRKISAAAKRSPRPYGVSRPKT